MSQKTHTDLNGSELEIELPSRPLPSATLSAAGPANGRQHGDETQSPLRALSSKSQPSTRPSAIRLSRLKSTLIIITLAGMSFLNTLGSGLLTTALPRIAQDIGLQENLLLWPASVYALAAGCLLLIFGAVADVVGAKLVWVTGSFLYVVFTLAVGLSQTGIQIILFRTLLGLAVSMCLPAAVSLTTNTFPRGQWRNMAFASIGMGQPVGYSVGLILGGVFTDTIGWRWGFYASAIINSLISVCAIWVLPPRVLSLSALQTSIRFLPMTIVGLSVNIVTGLLISRVQVRTLVVVSAIITCVASPLMATIHTDWSYWRAAFWAMLLSPVHPDVLFTVSNLIISNAYPGEEQSLAGGVFNQVSQIGNSVGLAVTAAIAASVTEHSTATGADALLKGYRAVFWTVFASMAVVVVVAFFGLKKGGLVGSKEE
ncbi:MAG: hypothetical protein Q9201_000585 [Fulgogasparrea decipioides]